MDSTGPARSTISRVLRSCNRYFDAAIDLAHRVHEELLDMRDLEVTVAPSLSTLRHDG